MRYALTLLIAALIASTAHAGYPCNSCYVQKQVVREVAYPQTIIQNQANFYSVGDAVRQYAVTPQAVAAGHASEIKREMLRLQDRLAEYQQYQQPAPQVVYMVPAQVQYAQPASGQQQAAPCADGTCATGQQPANPNFSLKQRDGIVAQNCLKCHSAGGAGVDHLDLTRFVSCDDMARAQRQMLSGKMPKGRPALNPTEFAQASAELLAWNDDHGLKPEQSAPPIPPQEQPQQPEQPPANGFSTVSPQPLMQLLSQKQ